MKSTQSFSIGGGGGGVRAPTRGQALVSPTRNPAKTSGGFRVKFFSLKNKGMLNCESLLESHVMRLLEVASAVVSYSEQPPALKLFVPGRKTSKYTPDAIVHWLNGDRWLVEVKPSELAAEPRTKSKLKAAAIAAEACGCEFVVLTEKHVKLAGIRNVAQVLEARRRQHVLALGEPQGSVAVADDAGNVARVEWALLEAWKESPSQSLRHARCRQIAAHERLRLKCLLDEILRECCK